MMNGKNKTVNKSIDLIPKNSVGAELGVWRGDTSAKLLTKSKFLYLVDSWSISPYKKSSNYKKYINRYKSTVGSTDPKDFEKYYDEVFYSVKQRFEKSPVKIYRMSTKQWFDIFDKKIDWIYVDANHSYDDTLHDLQKSLKLIKPGGLLFADDYGVKEGVLEAVQTFSKQTRLPFHNFYKDQVYFEIP